MNSIYFNIIIVAGWVEIRKFFVGFRSSSQPTKNFRLLLFRNPDRNPSRGIWMDADFQNFVYRSDYFKRLSEANPPFDIRHSIFCGSAVRFSKSYAVDGSCLQLDFAMFILFYKIDRIHSFVIRHSTFDTRHSTFLSFIRQFLPSVMLS
jgi:hypothetical protein